MRERNTGEEEGEEEETAEAGAAEEEGAAEAGAAESTVGDARAMSAIGGGEGDGPSAGVPPFCLLSSIFL